MAKFEFGPVLRAKIEACLNDVDLSEFDDEDLKEKIAKLDENDEEEYVDFEVLKKFQVLFNKFNRKGKKIYLHELIAGSSLYCPKYEPPPRNPELEARIQSLKARFANEEYDRMVKNVDLTSSLRYKNTFKAQTVTTDFRYAQGQLIAILNMVLVVIGSFVFGYKSIEYSLEKPNYLYQITGGFILAVIVAIADLYFLFKRLIYLDETQDQKKEKAKKAMMKSKTKVKVN